MQIAGGNRSYPDNDCTKESASDCIGAWQSPHTKETFGFAQAFRPQDGQVYFVLLASLFFLIKATV
jgi:hypothetical protein